MSVSFIPLTICGLFMGQFQPHWQPVSHPADAKAMAVNLDASGNELVMSWIVPQSRHEGSLKVARYQHQKWQSPVTIVKNDRLFINWADIPKVLVGDRFSLAVWPQMMGSGTYEYGLRFSRSKDGLKSWSPSSWLHDDRTPSEHGFVSLVRLPDGNIGAVWLDGQAMAAGHGDAHDGHGTGAMQLRYRKVMGSGLGPEVLLDEMTCECCGTDLITFKNQPVAIYRDRSENHIRDIRLAWQESGETWHKDKTIVADQWNIHGCPVNGPTLASNGETLMAAWFTMAGQKPKVRLASSGPSMAWQDHGELGEHPLGRVDIAFLDTAHFLLVWLESETEGDGVYYRIYRLSDGPEPLTEPLRLDGTSPGRASGFPKIATTGEGCFIAYQSPEKPGIKLQKLAWPAPKKPSIP